ncbi:MAG: hypothetical protein IPG12_07115 [Saprospiraceae bacterium]|nr:hypothetical protein [Saprospiraceae bacterium]
MKSELMYFILICSLLACSKDNDSTNQPPTNAKEYWYCSLDGKQYTLVVKDGSLDVESSLHIESSIAPLGQGTSYYKLGANIFENINDNIGFYLAKGTMAIAQGGYPSELQFSNFMNDQNNEFSLEALNGIEINFYDAQQEIWSTSLGSQMGSQFKFIKLTSITVLNDHYIESEAEFNCKLYNALGEVKQLVNGKCKLVFGYE